MVAIHDLQLGDDLRQTLRSNLQYPARPGYIVPAPTVHRETVLVQRNMPRPSDDDAESTMSDFT